MKEAESRKQRGDLAAACCRLILALLVALALTTPAQAAPTVKDYQIDWGGTDPQVDADDLPVDSGAWSNLAPITDTAQAVFDWLDSNWGSLLSISGTDNAVVRLDGTDALQDSGIFISDADALTAAAGSIAFTASSGNVILATQTGSTGNAIRGLHTGSGAGAGVTGDSTAATGSGVIGTHSSVTGEGFGVSGSTLSSDNEAYGGWFDQTYVGVHADFQESGARATPPSGLVGLYAKTDGLLYSKDDAGAETLVSGGAAFSGIGLAADIGSPATLEDGDTLTITGGDGIGTTVSGDTVTVAVDETVSRVLTTTDAAVVKSSFTAETVVKTVTIAADEFEDGDILRIKAYGNLSAFSGSPTFTIRLRYNGTGGTALCTWTRASLGAGMPSEKFELDADVNIHSLGASGTCRAAGLYQCIDRSLAYQHVQSNSSTAVTIDTTASKTYDLTVQCSASNSVNAATFDIVSIEHLK